jgi:hypothetical protein
MQGLVAVAIAVTAETLAGNSFFQMECAEGRGCWQHLGFSGINWHKLYSCARIRSARRLGPEVVGFAASAVKLIAAVEELTTLWSFDCALVYKR